MTMAEPSKTSIYVGESLSAPTITDGETTITTGLTYSSTNTSVATVNASTKIRTPNAIIKASLAFSIILYPLLILFI